MLSGKFAGLLSCDLAHEFEQSKFAFGSLELPGDQPICRARTADRRHRPSRHNAAASGYVFISSWPLTRSSDLAHARFELHWFKCELGRAESRRLAIPAGKAIVRRICPAREPRVRAGGREVSGQENLEKMPSYRRNGGQGRFLGGKI
jgi:hypothetical protein